MLRNFTCLSYLFLQMPQDLSSFFSFHEVSVMNDRRPLKDDWALAFDGTTVTASNLVY